LECSVGPDRAVVDEPELKLVGRALSTSFVGEQVSYLTLLAQSNRVKAKGLGPPSLNWSQAKCQYLPRSKCTLKWRVRKVTGASSSGSVVGADSSIPLAHELYQRHCCLFWWRSEEEPKRLRGFKIFLLFNTSWAWSIDFGP
jgi:hypothetical protein